jgi:hypothetical protein
LVSYAILEFMEDRPLVTPVNPSTLTPQLEKKSVSRYILLIPAYLLAIGAGIYSGHILSRPGSVAESLNTTIPTAKIIKTSTEAGSTDSKTFSDQATGTLEKGGLNGEGTHHLIRPGGASQTVYLVSSVVDLDEFTGKKVDVFGQTIKAQKVGWLMDVGRVKIVE